MEVEKLDHYGQCIVNDDASFLKLTAVANCRPILANCRPILCQLPLYTCQLSPCPTNSRPILLTTALFCQLPPYPAN